MGMLVLAERYVPSGVAALIVAVMPLWVVLLRTATGDRPAAAHLARGGRRPGRHGRARAARSARRLGGGRLTGSGTLWSLLLAARHDLPGPLGLVPAAAQLRDAARPAGAHDVRDARPAARSSPRWARCAASGWCEVADASSRSWAGLALPRHRRLAGRLHRLRLGAAARAAVAGARRTPTSTRWSRCCSAALILGEPITAGVVLGGAIIVGGVRSWSAASGWTGPKPTRLHRRGSRSLASGSPIVTRTPSSA